jgi:hypothetical protein
MPRNFARRLLLLPRTTAEAELKIAERKRTLIRGAGQRPQRHLAQNGQFPRGTGKRSVGSRLIHLLTISY